MADGLLPYLFSRSNAFRRNLMDMVSNPADYAAKMGGQVVDTGNELAELQERSGMFGAGPVDEAARDELYQRAADAAMNMTGMTKYWTPKMAQKNAAKLMDLLDASGIKYRPGKSNISPSRYVDIESGDNVVKVRFSDHVDKHMSDISSDPVTGMRYSDVVKELKGIGLPLQKSTAIKPTQISDSEIVKYYFGANSSKSISDVPSAIVERYRTQSIWKPIKNHPDGGYWVDKDYVSRY